MSELYGWLSIYKSISVRTDSTLVSQLMYKRLMIKKAMKMYKICLNTVRLYITNPQQTKY